MSRDLHHIETLSEMSFLERLSHKQYRDLLVIGKYTDIRNRLNIGVILLVFIKSFYCSIN